MANERPLHVSVEDVMDYGFQGATVSEKQAMSDLLDLIAFLETKKRDVEQGDLPGLSEKEKRFHRGPGEGYYQLERGPDGGGYVRANNGYTNLPKQLTPQWFHDHMKIARNSNNTWVMSPFNKEQQDFIMVSFLSTNSNAKEVVENLAQEDNRASRFDIMLNYWLDHHWAGWQNQENPGQARKDKKNSAIESIINDYKYEKNWIHYEGNIKSDFNLGEY